jgi:poly-beta-1,6-N-acetyl-D-glucosamine synthase
MVTISLGIIAYNEERNLPFLLKAVEKQRLKNTIIDELFLISDGSNDLTNEIIRKYKSKKICNLKKIIHKKREGKYKRINEFIKKSKNEIVALCNGDILIGAKCLEKLGREFNDSSVCLVTTKGIPLKTNCRTYNLNKIYWDLHHIFSLTRPKGTGLLAFRKNGILLPKTSVDETYLIALSKKSGDIKYNNQITYITNGPQKLSELISQIRRYHNGHKIVARKTGYKDITLNIFTSIKLVSKYAAKKPFQIVYLSFFMTIELIGRLLGDMDYARKKETFLWDIAETTKDLTS